MAHNTAGTYLMYKASGESDFVKLVDILNYPKIKGDKNRLDATTLSDWEEVQIDGIRKSPGDQKIEANYSLLDYKKVDALDDGKPKDMAIWFGGNEDTDNPTGDQGKWAGQALVSVSPSGGGNDEVRKMEISLTVTKRFELQV